MHSQSQGEVSFQISSSFLICVINSNFKFKAFWILLYVKYSFAEIVGDIGDISAHHLANRGLFRVSVDVPKRIY